MNQRVQAKKRTSAPPAAGEVTTGPIYRSHKVYKPVEFRDVTLQIPARRIELTNDTTFDVYDTSGIYTHENPELDLAVGLEKVRDTWPRHAPVPASKEHPELRVQTQLAWARAGVITPEMVFCAERL